MHSIQFTANTTCSDITITAYLMELRLQSDASVVESFTQASTTASTTGVTFNAGAVGGLPIIDVDETVITDDYRLVFVNFTTACGVASVNEFTDIDALANANFAASCGPFTNQSPWPGLAGDGTNQSNPITSARPEFTSAMQEFDFEFERISTTQVRENVSGQLLQDAALINGGTNGITFLFGPWTTAPADRVGLVEVQIDSVDVMDNSLAFNIHMDSTINNNNTGNDIDAWQWGYASTQQQYYLETATNTSDYIHNSREAHVPMNLMVARWDRYFGYWFCDFHHSDVFGNGTQLQYFPYFVITSAQGPLDDPATAIGQKFSGTVRWESLFTVFDGLNTPGLT